MSEAPARRRFLQPAHGWPAFATEITIVVLGVLIALGAQQAVDAWNTRRDVAEFRAALDAELAESLGGYQLRMAQGPCLRSRLAQLEAWQREWRDGDGPALSSTIGRPLAAIPSSSVWRSGAGATAARLPLKERLAYAALYDALDQYQALSLREVSSWQELFAYDQATRLTPAEVNRLRGLILAARSTDRSISLNHPEILASAAQIGVRPAPLAKPLISDWLRSSGLCQPLRLERAAQR